MNISSPENTDLLTEPNQKFSYGIRESIGPRRCTKWLQKQQEKTKLGQKHQTGMEAPKIKLKQHQSLEISNNPTSESGWSKFLILDVRAKH